VVVVEKRKHLLGEEHPETPAAIGNLAFIYWNQRKWKEAETLQVMVMEKTKYLLGEEHPNTLTAMESLASTYWNQGKWTESA